MSKFNEKEQFNLTENATLLGESDDESLASFQDKLNKRIRPNKENALMSLGHTPTVLFFAGLLIISLLVGHYSSNIISIVRTSPEKFEIKDGIETFSSQFESLSNIFKVIFLGGQMLLGFTLTCLFTFIKQSISKEEYERNRLYGYLIIAFSSLASVCLAILLFFFDFSNEVTKTKLGLKDNVALLMYLFSNSISFMIAYSTFYSQSSRSLQIFKSVFNSKNMKRVILIFLFVLQILYTISLFIVSIHRTHKGIESYVIWGFALSLSLSPILALFTQMIFVYSLKYDLIYVNLNFQLRIEQEYCIDLEANDKTVY